MDYCTAMSSAPAEPAEPATCDLAGLARRRAIAEAIAREAADCLLGFRGRLTSVGWKGEVDLVTEADRTAERLILDALRRLLPEDRVVGEEGGLQGPPEAPFTWYVDPLDGTTNFVHGLPHFAASLGAAWSAGPDSPPPVLVVGALSAPALVGSREDACGLTYSAARGLGATRNGLPIAVAPHTELGRALVATGFPYDRTHTAHALVGPLERALERCLCVRRLGSASLDLALVADGTFGAYWEPRLKPWDFAAGAVLVSEAGGRVTDLSGGQGMLASGDVLATNGLLHEAFLRDVFA